MNWFKSEFIHSKRQGNLKIWRSIMKLFAAKKWKIGFFLWHFSICFHQKNMENTKANNLPAPSSYLSLVSLRKWRSPGLQNHLRIWGGGRVQPGWLFCGVGIPRLGGWTTQLKNMFVKMDHLPRDKHIKASLKPPPRTVFDWNQNDLSKEFVWICGCV